VVSRFINSNPLRCPIFRELVSNSAMRTLTLVVALTAFLSLISSNCLSQTQPTGIVRGVVLDERGNPVAAASVIAYPADKGFTFVERASTNTDGSLTFEALPFGKYAISAGKPSAFYSDMFSAFSGGDIPLPIVELSQNQPTVEVNVRLLGKAAAIVLSIRDAKTQQEIFACVRLARMSEPEKSLRIGKQGKPVRVLLPANKDVTLVVWYPGYLPQTYIGSLRLSPTEVRKVTMKLVNDPAAKHKTEDELLLEMKHVLEEGCADR
jgi:hypothetical protein